jgi:hypothetical protein
MQARHVRDYSGKKMNQKAAHVLTGISANTLRAYSGNYRESVTRTETLEPLIRRLKNNTDSYLQQSKSQYKWNRSKESH